MNATLRQTISLMAIALLFLLTGNAYSDEECSYDSNGITYNYFLKHTKFKKAKWDNEEKIATISIDDSDDQVVVSYDACEDFGVNARYLIKKIPNKLNSDFLISKLLWLGSKILDDSNYRLLVAGIKNKQFVNDLDNIQVKKRVFVGIEGSHYASFLVYVVRDDGEFYVEISWSE